MKKTFVMTMTAWLGVVTIGWAQQSGGGAKAPTAAQQQQTELEAAYKKREAKSDADIENPKKKNLAPTWMDRGKLYLEAATDPVPLLRVDMAQKEMELIMTTKSKNPKKGSETINGVKYAKWQYPYLDVYLADGKVKFWLMTKEVLPGASVKAFEAYSKAYELDNKAKVKDPLNKLANHHKEEGGNLHTADKNVKAAAAFLKAYEVQRHPAINLLDTASLFNAGYLYMLGNKFQDGAKYLEQAKDYGYENNGNIYYMLYYCYKGLKKMDKGKEVLHAGLDKYPNNTPIVEYLVEHYTTTGEDPQNIVFVVRNAIELNPANAYLWSGLGRVYDQIGELDNAVEAFEKAAELSPKDFSAQYNCGLLFVKKADAMNKEMNEKQHANFEQVRKEVYKVYEQAVDPLEKALGLAPNPPAADPENQYRGTLELLKALTFRLRDESEALMAKYEHYNKLFKALSEAPDTSPADQ